MSAARPEAVRIDDYARPRFSADVRAIREAVVPMAAELRLEPGPILDQARAETGLTPKAAGRVIRFDRARKLLVRELATATADYRLADLAAACGYFDQAHLAREFRALAGCPPSQWLAEEFRNVQAWAAVALADS